MNYLPFHNIDDEELLNIYSNSIGDISYEQMYLNPYEVYDKFIGEANPDMHIDSEILYNRLMCDYYDVQNIDNMFATLNTTQNFTIMVHNIRSIAKNLEEFQIDFNVSKNGIDILAFCETRMSDDVECLYNIPKYNRYSTHRNTSGGGVSLYIADKYISSLNRDFTRMLPYLEMVSATVNRDSDQYLLCNVYRPPGSDLKLFCEAFDSILLKIATDYSNMRCVMMGDFNLNMLRVNSGTITHEFLSTMYSYGYMPQILRPTRVVRGSATLIDQVWVNDETLLINSGIVKSSISDHFPVFIDIVGNSSTTLSSVQVYQSRRVVNAECKENFNRELSQVDWGPVLSTQCADQVYTMLIEIISRIFNKCFPLIQKSRKKLDIDKPYIDNEIKSLIKRKHCLQRLYFKWPITYERQYKDIRNLVNNKIRKSKQRYYRDKLNCSLGNSKKIWRVLNELTGRRSEGGRSVNLSVNGSLIADPLDVATEFNKYFSIVGSTMAENFTQASDFEHYLVNINSRPLVFAPTDLLEVERIVYNMKETAPGHDSLPCFIFKDNFNILGAVLVHLFTLSMNNGVVPRDMLVGKVTTIFKSGDPMQMSNYRPISILPVLSKVLEKLIYSRVMNHLQKYNYLTRSQYGFRTGCSTEGALQDMCLSLYDNFEHGHYCLGAFLDLSKAFDSLDRDILLRKLVVYGIIGNELKWFKSYFSDRQQYVVYNNKSSSRLPVNYGAPQGSIIGPLLFLIYINDIVFATNHVKFILFADDTNLFYSSNNIISLYETFNNELDSIDQWLLSNKLTLNIDKTNYILFHRQQRRLPHYNGTLSIGGREVERVRETKFLGVILDESLTFKSHIALIAKRLSRYIGVFYRIRNFLTTKYLKLLFNSLVLPNLMYCNGVWGACSAASLRPLVTLQKRMIRVISFAPWLVHTDPLFNDL